MTESRRHILALLGGLLALPATGTLADFALADHKGRRRRRRGRDDDDDDDYDDDYDDDDYYDYKRAIKARTSGQIRPLSDILDTVSAAFKGRYIAIEFKQRRGAAFYDIKLLTPDGQYLDITVDAKANRIVKVLGDTK